MVTFKYDDPTSILVTLDFTVSDLTLPKNSELILDEGVLIGTDYSNSECQVLLDFIILSYKLILDISQ